MSEILLDKKGGLKIAISILNKEKELGDYGYKAIKEAELILKNILETLEAKEQITSQPEPKTVVGGVEESNKQAKTILDLEVNK